MACHFKLCREALYLPTGAPYMIYMELIPSSIIGLGFTGLALLLVGIRYWKPAVSRGATW